MIPITGEVRVSICSLAKPFHVVDVLQQDEVCPSPRLTESFELLNSEPEGTTQHHVVFEAEKRIIEVQLLVDVGHEVLGGRVGGRTLVLVVSFLSPVTLAILVTSAEGEAIRVCCVDLDIAHSSVHGVGELVLHLGADQDWVPFEVPGRADSLVGQLLFRVL